MPALAPTPAPAAFPLPANRPYRAAEEIHDEATALRMLRGDLAFAGAGKGGGGAPSRAELAERLALNKRTQGAFVGAGAAVAEAEAESAAAAAKEE